MSMSNSDHDTAAAFATSWNNLPSGSIYTTAQFEDWMKPLTRKNIEGNRVLELGCGNGSLLVHCCKWNPSELVGVDLGESVKAARKNIAGFSQAQVKQADLVSYQSPVPFDMVYCIGVLHHLKDPLAGFRSVLRNTKPGGTFHCWVYAREGNDLIVFLVDPIRKVASRFNWRINKYLLAPVLVFPFYLYSQVVRRINSLVSEKARQILKQLPLFDYAVWISTRDFSFYRHVAFDQLVTPQTTYVSKEQIQEWLRTSEDIDVPNTYIILRNGNSWKFGGLKKAAN